MSAVPKSPAGYSALRSNGEFEELFALDNATGYDHRQCLSQPMDHVHYTWTSR